MREALLGRAHAQARTARLPLLIFAFALLAWLAGCAMSTPKAPASAPGAPLITAVSADGNVAHITLKDNNPLPEQAVHAVLERCMEIAGNAGFRFFEFHGVTDPGQRGSRQMPPASWSVDPASNRATPSVMSLGITGGSTSDVAFYLKRPSHPTGLLFGVEDVARWRGRAVLGDTEDSDPEPTQFLLGGALATLPADARWDDLSLQQRRALRADQLGLTSDQEPPFPETGAAALIDAMIGKRPHVMSNTEVRLRIDVDEQGRSAKVVVLSTPDAALGQALVRSLASVRYRPGQCGPRACAMPFFVSMRLLPVDAVQARPAAVPISYPPAAARAGASGVVRALVRFAGDGRVREVVVTHSSGTSPEHKLLDQTTVDLLREHDWGSYLWHGRPIEGGWRAIDLVWKVN